MSYYWFNKKEILQKAKEKYDNCDGKEKAAEYYQANKAVLKEKAKLKFVKKEKKAKREYNKNKYRDEKKKCKFIFTV